MPKNGNTEQKRQMKKGDREKLFETIGKNTFMEHQAKAQAKKAREATKRCLEDLENETVTEDRQLAMPTEGDGEDGPEALA